MAVFDFDFDKFVRCVMAEFERYIPKHKRDKYEGNWMPFPIGELQALKQAVLKKEQT